MVWLSLAACHLFAGPDPAEIEAAAWAHRDAVRAAIPSGEEDCDAIDRLRVGEPVEGCGPRPPGSLNEVVEVSAACAALARRPPPLALSPDAGRLSADLAAAAAGVWTGAPMAVLACLGAMEAIAKELTPVHPYRRPALPDLALVAHGARWQGWLVAQGQAHPARLRGWWEVETALAHCGELTGPVCREALRTRGLPDTRVDLDAIDTAARSVGAWLDQLDRQHPRRAR